MVSLRSTCTMSCRHSSRKRQIITLETLIMCETYEQTLTCSTTLSSRLLYGLKTTCQNKKKSPSVSSFKCRLNRNRQIPHKYFSAGCRMGQILHARLRMERSSLNCHIYRKNIVSSASCSCGGFESTYHFFFTCPKYSRIRSSYLPHNLHTFHTEYLSHGRDDLSETENEQ